MRTLALDYGSARTGVAIADPTGTVVTPLEPVAALVSEQEVERVVVGLPLSLRGEDTAQTAQARAFAERLARRLGDGVAVVLHDERFTTALARRDPSPVASEDSRAAAHLLEDWLARSRPLD